MHRWPFLHLLLLRFLKIYIEMENNGYDISDTQSIDHQLDEICVGTHSAGSHLEVDILEGQQIHFEVPPEVRAKES